MALAGCLVSRAPAQDWQGRTAMPGAGEEAVLPDVVVWSAEGREVRVRDLLRGRYLVLEFIRSADW